MAANEDPQLTVPYDFYISLVQTCLHSLGRQKDTGHNPIEMAAHIQKVFGVPNSLHGEILKEQFYKPPETFLLRVTIMEAKDIIPKDTNGKSNPYCIIAICRKATRGHSPQKLQHQCKSSPNQNSSPKMGRISPAMHSKLSIPDITYDSSLSSEAMLSPTSACSASTPNIYPSASPTRSASSSPTLTISIERDIGIAKRNAFQNRSFRTSRRKSESADALHGTCSETQDVPMRLRSGSAVDPLHGIGSIGSIEPESMIRTTCKKQILHPLWNETFDLEVCGSNIDNLELRLTMWNWDGEETSLWKACKSLDSDHKRAGIKNIFRHVKGGVNKSTNDYMGQVVVPLADIPSGMRVDKWYSLHHGRHLAHNAGKAHLILSFVRKQESSEVIDLDTRLAYYYQLAAALFAYNGQKHIEESGTPWDGTLSKISQLFLNDYAIQQGIVKLSQQIINLAALLSFHYQQCEPKGPPSYVKEKHNFDKPVSAGITSLSAAEAQPSIGSGERYNPTKTGTTTWFTKGLVGSPVKETDPVLFDRGIREATYNVHAETITSLFAYEGKTKSVTEMYKNNPNFLLFEMALAEMSMCSYINLSLKRLPEVPSLFPASNLDVLEILQSKCRLATLRLKPPDFIRQLTHWAGHMIDGFGRNVASLLKLRNIYTLLSMKLWKNTETAPHRLVRGALTSTIKNGIGMWLMERFSRLPEIQGNLRPHELVELLDMLCEVIGELCEVCRINKDYKNFFMRYTLNYYKVVAQQVDCQICVCVANALSKLQQYQVCYQKFAENISESSKASLKLYMMVKRLVSVLRQCIDKRDELELFKFHTWFQEPLVFWLRTFQQETFDRVYRALVMDKDVVLVHQVVKYSNSAVDVQSCFAKVIQEWQQIGFEEPHARCVAITKLTELICEGTKLYANRVHWILEENGFYKEHKETKFDIKDKLCITLNNIEHVRSYLDNLPTLLEWNKNIQELASEHNDILAGKRTLNTLHRLTGKASEDVLMMSSLLEVKIADRMCREVSKFMDKVVNPSTNSNEDHLDELLGYIDNQLETLYKQLLPQIFPRIVEDLWEEILRRITSLVQIGKPPSYYHELRASLESLEAYFQRPGINLHASKVNTKERIYLDDLLHLNSKSTHELMLDYYQHLAIELATPADYIGHVGIKLIYENPPGNASDSKDDTGKETKTVDIKVCNAVDLPGMDRSGSSDPYVIVEVLPETSLANHTVYKTQIKEQILCPVFDETFQFADIPVSIIESGAVIGLTIMDHDFLVPDDFIGEVFYPLKNARTVDSQTIDNASMIMLSIKRPQSFNDDTCQVLKKRSHWDHYAKKFVAKRTQAVEKQKQRTDKTRKSTNPMFVHLGKAFVKIHT